MLSYLSRKMKGATLDCGYFGDTKMWYVSDVGKTLEGHFRWTNERSYSNFDDVLREHDTARLIVCDPGTVELLRQARPDSTKIRGVEYYS